MSHSLESETEEHFVVRDGKGTFKVPKKGLSPTMVQRIRAMGIKRKAEGGGVEYDAPAADAGVSETGVLTPVTSEPMSIEAPAVGMSTGPEAPWVGVEPSQAPSASLGPMPRFQPQEAGGISIVGVPQGEDPELAMQRAIMAQQQAGVAERAIPAGVTRQKDKRELTTLEQEEALLRAPAGAGAVSAGISIPAFRPVGIPGGPAVKPVDEKEFEAQQKLEKEAVETKTALAKEQGQYQAAYAQGQVEQAQKYALQQTELQAKAKMESDAAMARVKQASDEISRMDMSVDPGRFWASRSTGGKVAAILGLALGSIGAASDGVNRSVALLNQAIDRDLEAQKAEHTLRLQKGESALRAAQNMYSMQRQATQDDIAALSASKAAAWEVAENKLKAQMAGTSNQAALAQQQQLLAAIQAERVKHLDDVQKRTFDQTIQSGQLGVQRGQLAVAQQGLAMQGARLALAASQKGAKPLDRTSFSEVARSDFATRMGAEYLDEAKKIVKDMGTFEAFGTGQPRLKRILKQWAVAASKAEDPNSAVLIAEIEANLDSLGVRAGSPDYQNRALQLLDMAKGDLLRMRRVKRETYGMTPTEPLRDIPVSGGQQSSEE
jgi:hypothetical protein